MPEKHLYEYAVIRVVPKVERDEFINVGVILFSKGAKYIRMKCRLESADFVKFSDELDLELVANTLRSFEKICNGQSEGGQIALLDIPERFRWLTAVRSTCIQTSRPHCGFTDNLDKKVDNLFQELVL